MKRKIYFWVKKYINSQSIKGILMFTVVAALAIFQLINKEFDIMDYVDLGILAAFFLLAFGDVLSKLISFVVAKYAEDAAKVSVDYDALVERYKCMNLMKYSYKDSKNKDVSVIFPEECLWVRTGNENILIKDAQEKFYQLPKQIADNSKELMEAHSASKVYNKINIRLDDIYKSEDSDDIVLCTSRTQYFDSLVTNRACDYKFTTRRVTPRDLYEPGPYLKPLKFSKFSNHLGFNGFVITSDNMIAFVFRKDNLSIAKKVWGTSVQASLKTAYAIDPDSNNYALSENALGAAIVGELKDELGLEEDHALNVTVAQRSVFAFYRDLVEGGKPQFVFCMKLENINSETLATKIEENKKDKKGVTTDGHKSVFFKLNDLKEATFAQNGVTIKGVFYEMVPSSVVSVLLLVQNWEVLKKQWED